MTPGEQVTAFAEAWDRIVDADVAELGRQLGSPVVSYSWTDERRAVTLRAVLLDGRVIYGRGGGKLDALVDALPASPLSRRGQG